VSECVNVEMIRSFIHSFISHSLVHTADSFVRLLPPYTGQL